MLAISFPVSAQEQNAAGKKFKVCDIYAHPGFIIQANGDGSVTDFKLLAPSSTLTNNNFDGFHETGISVRL